MKLIRDTFNPDSEEDIRKVINDPLSWSPAVIKTAIARAENLGISYPPYLEPDYSEGWKE